MDAFREAKRLQQEREKERLLQLQQQQQESNTVQQLQTPPPNMRRGSNEAIRTFENKSYDMQKSGSVDYSRVPKTQSFQFSDSYQKQVSSENDDDEEEEEEVESSQNVIQTPQQNAVGLSDAPPSGVKTPGRSKLVLGDNGEFWLSENLTKYLFDHQEEGIRWLWSLWEKQKGGILGDDMGLGKTLQCCAFLTGMIDCKIIRRALVVVPPTLKDTWKREFEVCKIDYKVVEYSSQISKATREDCLRRIFRQRGVVLTMYGMMLHNSSDVSMVHGSIRFPEDKEDGPLWDIMILDEGHTIKNSNTKTHKNLAAIGAKVKIVISGTPIQNNLVEMHTLFNFCQPGILGDIRTFKTLFAQPIEAGQDKNAQQWEKAQAQTAQKQFMKTIGPYFLRREKNTVADGSWSKSKLVNTVGNQQSRLAQSQKQMEQLGQKTDLIVWLKLKPIQRSIYKLFLNSSAVNKVLNTTGKVFPALLVLKKICDHPALVSKRATRMVISTTKKLLRNEDQEFIDDSSDDDSEWEGELGDEVRTPGKETKEVRDEMMEEIDGYTQEQVEKMLIEQIKSHGIDSSCKTTFVLELLEKLVAEGHRTLIFSQSKVMLNILQQAIQLKKYSYDRIDGDIPPPDRTEIVRRFQEPNSNISVLLLTTQVGGLGLTLTGADRVIIIDPSWNPSIDKQAIDRAHRMGQQKNVVVYRLITSGSIEEKILRRQVFKDAIFRMGVGKSVDHRYFSKEEIKQLFYIIEEEFDDCSTANQLNQHHSDQSDIYKYPELAKHVQQVKQTRDVLDISEHNLLYKLSENQTQQQQQKTNIQNNFNNQDQEELETKFQTALKLDFPDSPQNQNQQKLDDFDFQAACQLQLPEDTPVKNQQQQQNSNIFTPQSAQQFIHNSQYIKQEEQTQYSYGNNGSNGNNNQNLFDGFRFENQQNSNIFNPQPPQQFFQNQYIKQEEQTQQSYNNSINNNQNFSAGSQSQIQQNSTSFTPQRPQQVMQNQFFKQQDQIQQNQNNFNQNFGGGFWSELQVKDFYQKLHNAEQEMNKYQQLCNNYEVLNKLPDKGAAVKQKLQEYTEEFKRLQQQSQGIFEVCDDGQQQQFFSFDGPSSAPRSL